MGMSGVGDAVLVLRDEVGGAGPGCKDAMRCDAQGRLAVDKRRKETSLFFVDLSDARRAWCGEREMGISALRFLDHRSAALVAVIGFAAAAAANKP